MSTSDFGPRGVSLGGKPLESTLDRGPGSFGLGGYVLPYEDCLLSRNGDLSRTYRLSGYLEDDMGTGSGDDSSTRGTVHGLEWADRESWVL